MTPRCHALRMNGGCRGECQCDARNGGSRRRRSHAPDWVRAWKRCATSQRWERRRREDRAGTWRVTPEHREVVRHRSGKVPSRTSFRRRTRQHRATDRLGAACQRNSSFARGRCHRFRLAGRCVGVRRVTRDRLGDAEAGGARCVSGRAPQDDRAVSAGTCSLTGSAADLRTPLRASEVNSAAN